MFLRVVVLIATVLVIFGAWRFIPQKESVVNVYYETDFTAAPEGVVGFPSWNASTAKELIEGPDSAEIKVNGGGLLVLPTQASATTPVPAVVILHGSGATGQDVVSILPTDWQSMGSRALPLILLLLEICDQQMIISNGFKKPVFILKLLMDSML